MPRIALLTLEDRTGYVIDDELAITELCKRGIDTSEIPWTDTAVDWSTFDLVIVRTTWDYHHRPDEFLAALARIDASETVLENPRILIAWNLDKRYLQDLEERGVPIVPSVWGEGGSTADFHELFTRLGCDEIVVKPVVSANALDTFRLRAPLGGAQLDELARTFNNRLWLAQPFVHSITTEGELSIFYFGGEYSHAVRKIPRSGDFRVQEEHGGFITAESPDADVRAVSDAVIRAIRPAPFQARVDLVTLGDGSMALIELELIEPSLYFRMDAHAPGRFADAVQALLQRHATSDR
jgi:glutathione synthase/RimK-type ligase-like ATP-grasp enzyme